MSPYDLALICGTVCYLGTVGAGLTAVLAYRRQARIAAPPREAVQQQDAAAEQVTA
jgi:hypothetical protein